MQRLMGLLFLVAVFIASAMLNINSAAARQSDVVGHVYVNNNSSVANTITGFDRHADGTLTPIAGSPFVIGGAGGGGTTPSQGALQLSSDGKYLVAANTGSNQISVLRINRTAAFEP